MSGSSWSSSIVVRRDVEMDLNAEVDDLFRDYLHWKLALDPFSAHRQGFKKYKGRGLPKVGVQEIAEAEAQCQPFKERSEAILDHMEAKTVVDPSQLHYVKVVQRNAQACIQRSKYQGYAFPTITFMDSFVPSLAGSYAQVHADIKDQTDLDYAIADLQDVPNYVDKVVGQLMNGVARNLTFHEISVSNLQSQLDSFVETSFEDSDFSSPFLTSQKTSSDILTEEVIAKAKQVYADEIVPSVERLSKYFSQEYIQHLRKGPGLSWLLGGHGVEAYNATLQYYNNNEAPHPKAIHKAGLAGIKKIKKNTQKIIAELGLPGNMTFKEFVDHARDTAVPLEDADELISVLKNLTEDINSRLHKVIPEKYLTEEYLGLHIQPSPGNVGLPLYFIPGSVDGSRLGTFYINVQNPNVFKRYELPTITLHEANPGHNFAFAINSKLNIPDFLKVSLTNYPPALVEPLDAYNEGWGLYTEALGPEIGLYDGKPFDLFGYYGGDLLRYLRENIFECIF